MEEEKKISVEQELQSIRQQLQEVLAAVKSPKPPVQLFNLKNAAKMLDVSVDTVRDWVTGGQLPATKLLGRSYHIHARDLEAISKTIAHG